MKKSRAQGRDIGLRRACALRGGYAVLAYYRAMMPFKDEVVIAVMKELSGKHPR